MAVPPCGMGTKLEPICGREAARRPGVPRKRDEIPIPPSGRGTCRQVRPFLLLACGLLLFSWERSNALEYASSTSAARRRALP